MRITKIQNLNFNHSDSLSGGFQPDDNQNDAQDTSSTISTNKQLVPTQPTEYKRFKNVRQNSNNPFLAQYIDQSSSQRSRGFIGRKPALQVQKSYENTAKIVKNKANSSLDMAI